MPTVVDGIRFDSKREADRWGVLSLLQRAGKIASLQRQVRFPIVLDTVLICAYVADFVYEENECIVVEDAKGVRTPEYKLKKKLMLAVHGIAIKEV